ncbi:hypothetical protein [Dyella caseinilytica]|uniref:Uncharacterized protein n=1 Tax=Dyella caseinilytica TaxID=1849581 RepID=A0ABX7GY36_9GAMM|nr:hypothetical protein [Dyella caseinilytica]QRN55384.1 hypothetical protein ISN74_08705 [Dyella caseinilytica]GGA01318.1 hypothetical protein GCM10011408_23220 [Dyella caseinilytica]
MTKSKLKKETKAPAKAVSEADLVAMQEADQRAAERRRKQSHSATNSVSNSTLVVEAYGRKVWGELDLQAIHDELADKCKLVFSGDTRAAESLLISQANALDAMFSALSCRALAQDYLNQFDTNLRLALKAQNQCRMTLETLAAIKNPPVVFAKQANIAHGHQQVNNGTPHAHAGQIENKPNKLLGYNHGERMDTGATGTASGSNKTMATMAVLHRPADRHRQGKRQP